MRTLWPTLMLLTTLVGCADTFKEALPVKKNPGSPGASTGESAPAPLNGGDSIATSVPTNGSVTNAPNGPVQGQEIPQNVPANPTSPAPIAHIRFGVAPQWSQNYAPPTDGPQNVDVVVVGDWLIEKGFTSVHLKKTQKIISLGKKPYFFGYIATSIIKKGLGESNDCDGNTAAKLCLEGADYLRNHLDSEIVPAYKAAARGISASVGNAEALIHIEPDFYQFSEKAQRKALTRVESNAAMNKILAAIKSGCKSCTVVIDFSPWFSPDRTQWATSAGDFYAGWDRSTVKYVGLTGKPFPFTEDKIDNFTYKQITAELGLPLVIVDGYTFGGGPVDIDPTWLNAANVEKARSMGVSLILLSQQGRVADYDAFITSYRQSY